MNDRLHAAAVIARRQVLETMISPGFWLTHGVGLLLGALVVNGFVASVGSGGFDWMLNPVFALLGRILDGAFGKAFSARLMSEGPFLLAFVSSFTPVFLFLSVSSVFRFGLEKNVGAVELLTYGPADGTSYITASYLRDTLLTVAVSVGVFAFLALDAALQNLPLGSMFLTNILIAVFLSLTLSAWGVLASTLSASAASGLALFFSLLLVFLALEVGMLTISSGEIRAVVHTTALLLRWVSPLFYAGLASRAREIGSAAGLTGSLAALAGLSAALLVASHLVISKKGVRP